MIILYTVLIAIVFLSTSYYLGNKFTGTLNAPTIDRITPTIIGTFLVFIIGSVGLLIVLICEALTYIIL